MEFEIKQLNNIRDYLKILNKELTEYNNNYEINELSKIQNNFENNIEKYISNTTDNNFKQALQEIKEFVHGKNINTLLESLKNILKDVEADFYIDESLNLVSYCWCLQNGHEYIVDL